MKRVYLVAKNADYLKYGWEEQKFVLEVEDEFYTIEDAIHENGYRTEEIDGVIYVYDENGEVIEQDMEIEFITEEEE